MSDVFVGDGGGVGYGFDYYDFDDSSYVNCHHHQHRYLDPSLTNENEENVDCDDLFR